MVGQGAQVTASSIARHFRATRFLLWSALVCAQASACASDGTALDADAGDANDVPDDGVTGTHGSSTDTDDHGDETSTDDEGGPTGDDTEGTDNDATSDTGETDGGDSSGTDSGDTGDTDDGHAVGLAVTMTPDDGGTDVSFLTAAASVVTIPAADIIGKPYYVAVFDGGFEQGVDLNRTHHWGIVPDDLHVEYLSPAMFSDGPYDISFIVYTNTEITEDIKQQPFPPAPVAGELSGFTLSQDQVKPGDPGFENGVVRLNVEGADATLVLENRHDTVDLLESFTDTVLIVP